MGVGQERAVLEIGDDETVRRQLLLPRMAERRNQRIDAEIHYPEAFPFIERSDGRRVESVIWERHCDDPCTVRHGLLKQEADRARRLEKFPNLQEGDLDYYAGYLKAAVGEIRECRVFRVEHAPELEWFAHTHIELLPECVDILTAKFEEDGAPTGGGTLSPKLARAHANNMLLRIFERLGLIRPQELPAGRAPILIEGSRTE